MKKLSHYFLGDILKETDDAFEQARAILLFRLCLMFAVIFFLPLLTDIILGLEKAVVIHSFGFLMLVLMPFIIKMQKNIERSVNFLFAVCTFVSTASFIILNPTKIHLIGLAWTIFFLILSALLQRGKTRLLFCCFLNWLPVLYVLLNTQLNGSLTISAIQQEGAGDPPVFLIFIPIILSIYAVWTNTSTIEHAKNTINAQKYIIAEKNKDILDSMHYAKRIQDSLLPNDSYLSKHLKRLKKE
jgi:hypothetical protein